MKKLVTLTQLNLKNLLFLASGASLFYLSFTVGESSLIGGAMHLSGCALFCAGVHRRWCASVCHIEDDTNH